MDRLLSKTKLLLFFLVASLFAAAQQVSAPQGASSTDYKDREQFDKFYKRRTTVGAWQINQLKTGALVVRLKTDKAVIDALLKEGNKKMAEIRRLEAYAVNKSIVRAFLNHYNFSKVYFMFSNSSDSLAKGARSGIFLDSNLKVNPAITMNEKFYLLAESDNLYNSSIGFIKEDSARFAVERGNPTTRSAAIVLKNKYGHQLKHPFPYAYYGTPFSRSFSSVYEVIDKKPVLYNIEGTFGSNERSGYIYEGENLKLTIPKDFAYEVYSMHVGGLNSNLIQYYRESPEPERSPNFEDAKPFLY